MRRLLSIFHELILAIVEHPTRVFYPSYVMTYWSPSMIDLKIHRRSQKPSDPVFNLGEIQCFALTTVDVKLRSSCTGYQTSKKKAKK
jgi:hypothetical protein